MTLDVPPPKGPLFVFGDPFLRRFLTIYDRDGPQVGFAVAQQPGLSQDDITQLLATVGGSGAPAKPLSSPDDASDASASGSPSAPVAQESTPDTPPAPEQVVVETTTTSTTTTAAAATTVAMFASSNNDVYQNPLTSDKIMDKLTPDQPAPVQASADPAPAPPAPASAADDSLNFASTLDSIEHPHAVKETEFDSWAGHSSKAQGSSDSAAPAMPAMSVDAFVRKWSSSVETGMLQVGEDSGEDHLVSISLKRTKGRVTTPQSL